MESVVPFVKKKTRIKSSTKGKQNQLRKYYLHRTDSISLVITNIATILLMVVVVKDIKLLVGKVKTIANSAKF